MDHDLSLANRYTVFERFQAANPHPTTELEYGSVFQLLVAVILSAQATDKSVNIATRILFPVAPDPERLYALGEDGLIPYIRRINLYRTKAKHLIQTADRIMTIHQGQVPASREALEQLPGVGRKTANVILNTAFGHPTIAVDTHIFRVANRTGLGPGRTVRAVENALAARIPEPFLRHAHHWLILHGRYICKARKPACDQCAIADLCPSYIPVPMEKTSHG